MRFICVYDWGYSDKQYICQPCIRKTQRRRHANSVCVLVDVSVWDTLGTRLSELMLIHFSSNWNKLCELRLNCDAVFGHSGWCGFLSCRFGWPGTPQHTIAIICLEVNCTQTCLFCGILNSIYKRILYFLYIKRVLFCSITKMKSLFVWEMCQRS